MSEVKDPVRAAVAQIGVAVRRQRGAEAVHEARRALVSARVERAINRGLADAPPLTDAQKSRLAQLLVGGAA